MWFFGESASVQFHAFETSFFFIYCIQVSWIVPNIYEIPRQFQVPCRVSVLDTPRQWSKLQEVTKQRPLCVKVVTYQLRSLSFNTLISFPTTFKSGDIVELVQCPIGWFHRLYIFPITQCKTRPPQVRLVETGWSLFNLPSILFFFPHLFFLSFFFKRSISLIRVHCKVVKITCINSHIYKRQ